MHSPLYTNATLAEAERRRRLGVTREPGQGLSNAISAAELNEQRTDPVEEAKQYLARAPRVAEVVAPEDRLAALPRPPRGQARQLTDILEQAMSPVAVASLIPSPVQSVAAGLTAGTYGLAGLRRLLMPEPDESRLWGAIEVGSSVLPGLSGLRAAKKLRDVPAADSVVREAIKTARDYLGKGMSRRQAAQRAGVPSSTVIPTGEHFQRAVNPNQVLAVAREVMSETGEPLVKALKGKGGKTGFTSDPASLRALQQLAESGTGQQPTESRLLRQWLDEAIRRTARRHGWTGQ